MSNSTQPARGDARGGKAATKSRGPSMPGEPVEVVDATSGKGGRKPLDGKRAMSSTERSRRRRERERQAKPAPPLEKQMAGVTVEAVLAEIIASHGLTTALQKKTALKVAKAYARDNPRDAQAWLSLLPPARSVDAEGRTLSSSDARQRVLALIMNHCAAHQIEEETEVERLRAENARLRAKCGEAPPPSEVIAGAGNSEGAPKTSPPSEHGNPRRFLPSDDWNHKPPVVLDVKPTVLDAGAPVAAKPAEPPAPAPEPAPSPQTPGRWDESENAAKWREWSASHPDYVYY